MVLKYLRCEGVDWIHLAHDKDRCQALANTTCGFHEMWRKSYLNSRTVDFNRVLLQGVTYASFNLRRP